MAEVRTRCDSNRDSSVQTLNLGVPPRHKSNFEPQTIAPATAADSALRRTIHPRLGDTRVVKHMGGLAV